ncbi:MAG: CDP-alcohol phosphatidyltransferase family protein [Promethearchaeota archaeon]
MTSRWRVRRIFKPLVNWIAKGCAKVGIKPNHATWTMLVLAVLASFTLVLTRIVWLFGILVFVTGLFDGVDGAIARQRDMATPSGGFLDSFLDRISEFVIFWFLYWFLISTPPAFGVPVVVWIFVAMFGSFLTSYTRARAYNEGVRDLDVGLMGRSERLFTLFLSATLNEFIAVEWPIGGILVVGIVFLAITTNLTALYRIYYYKRQLENLELKKDTSME